MNELLRPSISRRSVLRWTAAGVAVTAVQAAGVQALGAQASAAAAALTVQPTSAGERPVHIPEAGNAVTAPVDLGAVLHSAASTDAGTSVTFRYDPRLYQLLPSPVAVGPRGPIPATAGTPSVDPRTGQHSVTVTLADALSAGASVTVIAGQLRPNRYPTDIIHDLGTVRAGATSRHGSGQRTLSRRNDTARTVQPWGGEVGVLWEPITWQSDRYRYYCPRQASLRSVGPGAVPGGYRLRVTADAAVVGDLTLVAAHGQGGSKAAGAARRADTPGAVVLEWTAAAAVPAGSVVHLQLSWRATARTGPLTTVSHPMVTFLPPASAPGQRTTFLESVTRQDSVIDEESRVARQG